MFVSSFCFRAHSLLTPVRLPSRTALPYVRPVFCSKRHETRSSHFHQASPTPPETTHKFINRDRPSISSQLSAPLSSLLVRNPQFPRESDLVLVSILKKKTPILWSAISRFSPSRSPLSLARAVLFCSREDCFPRFFAPFLKPFLSRCLLTSNAYHWQVFFFFFFCPDQAR